METTAAQTTRVDKYVRMPMSRGRIPADQETIHLRPEAWLAAEFGSLVLASRRAGNAERVDELTAKAAEQPEDMQYLIRAALDWAAEQGHREALGERWTIAKMMHDMQASADPIACPAQPEQPTTCSHGVSYSADCAGCARTSYLLGRAYGIREAIAGLAEGDPRTGSDRWFAAIYEDALRRPVGSAGKLARMTREDVRRAKLVDPGATAALVEDLDRIAARIDDRDINEPMSDAESAAWIAGYHQQRTEFVRRGLEFARASLAEAVESAKAQAVALVVSGMSEVEAARRCGIDRMTVRKALGKD